MKVTVFPKKEMIHGIIQERVDAQRKLLDEDNSELAKIVDSKIIRPGQDIAAKHQIRSRTEYITQLENQLKLIDAHDEGSVATEIEL